MALGPVMLGLDGLELSAEEREMLCHPRVGGVILFARNYRSPEQVAALTAAIHALRQPRIAYVALLGQLFQYEGAACALRYAKRGDHA